MERIIKFSIPKYKKIFDFQEKLAYNPYCICYQYDVEKQYGPYGFNTESSKQLVKSVFGEILYWDFDKLHKACKTNIFGGAINFYGKIEGIRRLYEESLVYQNIKKKNEILTRHSKPIQELPEKPLIFELFNGELYKSSAINKLIEAGIPFFIRVYYAPEAGESLLLFDDSIIEKIKLEAIMNNINFIEVNSIDELKPW